MKHLLLSTERNFNGEYAMFWNQNQRGYTPNIMEAGKFDEDFCRKIVDGARGKEIAFSFEYVCSESEIVDIAGHHRRFDGVKIKNLGWNAATVRYDRNPPLKRV